MKRVIYYFSGTGNSMRAAAKYDLHIYIYSWQSI